VVPLASLGVVDIAGCGVSDSTLLVHTLSNTCEEECSKAYAVRCSGTFVNEYARRNKDNELTDGGPENPNHLYSAFPCLFPYAKGGFEVSRPHAITYEDHTRWAIQYVDGQFRRDHYFIFQVFGVLQKRQVCMSAMLRMRRATYIQHEMLLQTLTPQDLQKASKEERRQAPISNPAVKCACDTGQSDGHRQITCEHEFQGVGNGYDAGPSITMHTIQ
jgi:hypothetical protein